VNNVLLVTSQRVKLVLHSSYRKTCHNRVS